MIPISGLAPISYPVLDFFLIGFVCASSLVVALFFLRFWRQTRDPLFLAFTLFFAIEGANEAYTASLLHPNVGSFAVTMVRLLSVLGVIFAIIWKNLA
ncbi:MAG: DUF5985 family protein [Terracidiphilus sp.]